MTMTGRLNIWARLRSPLGVARVERDGATYRVTHDGTTTRHDTWRDAFDAATAALTPTLED